MLVTPAFDTAYAPRLTPSATAATSAAAGARHDDGGLGPAGEGAHRRADALAHVLEGGGVGALTQLADAGEDDDLGLDVGHGRELGDLADLAGELQVGDGRGQVVDRAAAEAVTRREGGARAAGPTRHDGDDEGVDGGVTG